MYIYVHILISVHCRRVMLTRVNMRRRVRNHTTQGQCTDIRMCGTCISICTYIYMYIFIYVHMATWGVVSATIRYNLQQYDIVAVYRYKYVHIPIYIRVGMCNYLYIYTHMYIYIYVDMSTCGQYNTIRNNMTQRQCTDISMCTYLNIYT